MVEAHPDRLEVVGISAYSNASRLIEQAKRFHPSRVWIGTNDGYQAVKAAFQSTKTEVMTGRESLLQLAGSNGADLVLNAIVGAAGMEPTLAAIGAGNDVALSNKETLVMAGPLIAESLERHEVELYPVDSEHSAIWQVLRGEDSTEVHRLLLTGSGGPFRTTPHSELHQVTVNDALNHPNWSMGKKITIDSATMMNKGLEVIEAHWMFHIPPGRIDVIIHPQSIVHSMVEFQDGSVKAQLGVPDMKVPIQYALLYPEHLGPRWESLDLVKTGGLTFESPDFEKFPALGLAYKALKEGGTMPAVLNVANEVAVEAFLNERIGFLQIPQLVEEAMSAHSPIGRPEIDEIRDTERWTKAFLSPKLQKP